MDITIICEEPHIQPYRVKMKKALSNIICIKTENISIKATTTEGLGFTGRKEGIAVQSIVTTSKYNTND